MGAIVFLIMFLCAMMVYPAICISVWLVKYRKQMTYTEFERRYHL
jgi:hypothetical protein